MTIGEPLKPFLNIVAGVGYKNSDGTDRQKILKKCKIGEKLILTHEPIPQDENAVKVCRENGEQIGWLTKSMAMDIAHRLDRGSRVDASIYEIKKSEYLRGKGNDCLIQLRKYTLR